MDNVEQISASVRNKHIQGWGADLDPINRPAYPKERTPPRLDNLGPHQLVQQEQKVPVFHSNERPGITPIFGTSTPPSGISGRVRAFAFKFSENDIRHWLLLLFADRINMGEGLAADLKSGHIPNIFAEMGGPAEWRHNRKGFMRKAAIATTVVGLSIYLMKRKRR